MVAGEQGKSLDTILPKARNGEGQTCIPWLSYDTVWRPNVAGPTKQKEIR